MVRPRRFPLYGWGMLALGLASAGLFFSLTRHFARRETERWFIPGALGHEGGRCPSGPATAPARSAGLTGSGGAFLTRALGVDAEWGRRNHLTASLAFSHNLGRVFPPELAREHPEFFPLAAGQRLQPPLSGALFWNPDLGRPDVARHAAEAARAHFAEHPDDPSFALGVNDALVWGESPELLALVRPGAWFRERPDYSNLVFTFMNRAAEELARTHPQKYLGALAYYWAENAPDFPLHPQVVPFLTADRAQGYDRGFRAEELALQQRWAQVAGVARLPGMQAPLSKAGGSYRWPAASRPPPITNNQEPITNNSPRASFPRRLGIYDYLYGHGYLVPRLHPRLLAEHLRHARRAGFTDYYAEMNPNWGLDGPMPWLAAQLLADPECPEADLLAEYYRRFFQEAAAPMREFFERCEALWLAQPGPPYWLKHYRNESQAVIFPLAACRELRARLDEARRRAATEKVRRRVEIVSAAFGLTERFVLFQESRDRLARFALAPAPEAVALTAALGFHVTARREFIRYTMNLRREQPLAVAPFGWDDYLKNDPVPGALLALAAARGRAAAGGEKSVAPGGAVNPIPLANDREPGTDSLLTSESQVGVLWASVTRMGASPGHELLRDPGMDGEVRPARRIAGMDYGVALPADWVSQVEPAEFHRAVLLGAPGGRVLRISGSRDTTISQWDPVGGNGLHRARLTVRGRVSPGTAVSLIFAWLDSTGRHVGFKVARLPDGDWPEWVILQQAGVPPAGAAWVGIGLRVQNQVREDWIEARDFSLRHYPPAVGGN